MTSTLETSALRTSTLRNSALRRKGGGALSQGGGKALVLVGSGCGRLGVVGSGCGASGGGGVKVRGLGVVSSLVLLEVAGI